VTCRVLFARAPVSGLCFYVPVGVMAGVADDGGENSDGCGAPFAYLRKRNTSETETEEHTHRVNPQCESVSGGKTQEENSAGCGAPFAYLIRNRNISETETEERHCAGYCVLCAQLV